MSSICLFKSVHNAHRTFSTKCFSRVLSYCLNDVNTDRRERYHGHWEFPNKVITVRTPHLYHHSSFSTRGGTDAGKIKKQSSFYHELYLLEKFRFIRLLGRFSKYSCISFMIGAPLCVLSVAMNMMPLETSKFIITNLGFYSAIFSGQSFIFSSRILGKIMISDDEKIIKFSHFSLFGNRKDIFITPSDILPLQDVHSALSNKKMVMIHLKNSKRFIFLPELGTSSTNFEVIELIFSNGLKQEVE